MSGYLLNKTSLTYALLCDFISQRSCQPTVRTEPPFRGTATCIGESHTGLGTTRVQQSAGAFERFLWSKNPARNESTRIGGIGLVARLRFLIRFHEDRLAISMSTAPDHGRGGDGRTGQFMPWSERGQCTWEEKFTHFMDAPLLVVSGWDAADFVYSCPCPSNTKQRLITHCLSN